MLKNRLYQLFTAALILTIAFISANAQTPKDGNVPANLPLPVAIQAPAQDEPWLVTIIHEVDLLEIQAVLLKRGIQMRIDTQTSNFKPINVTTGIVIDHEGHILTRLININPEAGEKGVGKINILLPSGEQKEAHFVGIDGPSGFCLLAVDNLNIAPAPLATTASLESGGAVTLLNVEFERRSRLEVVKNLSRKLLSQIGKIAQFPNQALFSVSMANGYAHNSVSYGVVMNNNREILGIPDNIQNNSLQVFTAPEAYRAARRVIARKGNVPRGWLGISCKDISELPPSEFAKLGLPPQAKGVYIGYVVPNSPAESSGLRKGDVVISLNYQPLNSNSQFLSAISLQPAGENIEVDYWRNGLLNKLSLVLGERGYSSVYMPDDVEERAHQAFAKDELQSIDEYLQNCRNAYQELISKQANNNDIQANKQLQALINQMSELESKKDRLAKQLNLSNQMFQNFDQLWLGIKSAELPALSSEPNSPTPKPLLHGVRVIEILPKSLAQQAGLQVGDIIYKLDGYLINSKDDVGQALLNLKRSRASSFQTFIKRNNEDLTIRVSLPAGPNNRK